MGLSAATVQPTLWAEPSTGAIGGLISPGPDPHFRRAVRIIVLGAPQRRATSAYGLFPFYVEARTGGSQHADARAPNVVDWMAARLDSTLGIVHT